MAGPLRGGAGARGLGAPTINAVKMSTTGPLGGAGAGGPRAPTINAVKASTAGPLGGGVRAGGLGAPTINAVKMSMAGPPGRCQSWRSGSAHHQHCKNVDGGPPERRCQS
jgi:hypothetical protein